MTDGIDLTDPLEIRKQLATTSPEAAGMLDTIIQGALRPATRKSPLYFTGSLCPVCQECPEEDVP